MAKILLGVTGGIAAYKALEFARLATLAGHSVRVIQTHASTRFVGTASFTTVTGAPVLIEEWEGDPLRGAFPGEAPPAHAPLSHLELVARADAYLIAPASANTLAKLATGAGDNLVTVAALACRSPMIVAPAMNDAMYRNPATQANLSVLRERGVLVLAPGTGALGSIGERGVGRLPEAAELLEVVDSVVAQRPAGSAEGAAADGAASQGSRLAGKRVLITTGGTREPIDSVRYVGNRSSGRMGWALAERARAHGAQVTVVAANVALERRDDVSYVDVSTAAELGAACEERFGDCDVLLMAAAVADFTPAGRQAGKIKKDTAGEGLVLELARTPDVLAGLSGRRSPGQVLIGFAAEHGDGAVAYGRGKLERKRLDAVVVNDISRPGIGFDSPDNEVTIVLANGERHVARAGKAQVADAILDVAAELLTRPFGA